MAIIETSALDATNVQTAFEAIIKGKLVLCSDPVLCNTEIYKQ